MLLTLGFIFELGKNALTIESRQTSFNNGEVSNPHAFYSKRFTSAVVITEILAEIDTLLPQLANFIGQFNSTVSQSGIHVVTDVAGNMGIDIPGDMSQEVGNKLGVRIGIIDRLITTRGQEINDLLQKGISLEKNLKITDPNYVSQITDRLEEFKKLNSSYKH
ncbi:MAG: hypothetical protein EOP34_09350 [Rickettsiales bacterium]|nr:MAG: hypothetical protein EOP34_09350 [Rickettsiales bacterium]